MKEIKKEDIVFLGYKSRTSAIVRGVQVANSLGCQFFDLNSISNSIIDSKIVVFTKFYHPQLVDHLKSLGIVVGLDLIAYNTDTDLTRSPAIKKFDFIITNNSLHEKFAQKIGHPDQKFFIIPHHSCNFEGTINNFNDVVKKVGYVGLPEQLRSSEKIKSFCQSMDIEFISEHPGTREQCSDILSTLDIAVTFLHEKDNDPLYNDRILYKPNVKLTNYQSFGIPSIVTEIQSYKEFGGSSYLSSTTEDEFFHNLEVLCKDTELRRKLSMSSCEVSKKYSLEKVRNLYVSIFQHFLEKGTK